MRVDEDSIMDITEYAAIMQVYKDVYQFMGNRFESVNKAVEKKFGKKGEAGRRVLIGAMSYAMLMSAVTSLMSARSVLDTDAINDLIDGFISELEDLKKSPKNMQ